MISSEKIPPAVSPYWSRLAASLSPYIPGEQPRDRKFIKLNTNENPYPPSPKVIEAIRNAADSNLRLYPDPACTAIREAAAVRWNVKPQQVFAGNGSDEILAFAFAAFFDSCKNENAEPLLFPDITYSFYPVYAALWDIPFLTPATGAGFIINPDDYKTSCGGVIFPNPNAPTGRALDQDAIEEIVKCQNENKNAVIIDEAYMAFANRGKTGTAIPLVSEYNNLLVIRTLSKDSALAGLRSGYAVGSEELIEGLCRIRDSFNSYTMDRLAQAATAAAILDAAYCDEINARVSATRDRTAAALRDLGFIVIPSEANFVFVSPPGKKTSGPSGSAAGLMQALRDRGILVRHFKQPKTENFLRISIGTDEDMNALLNACREICG